MTMIFDDWRAFTSILNMQIAAILDMKISWFSNLSRIIHQCSEKNLWRSYEYWLLESVLVTLEYANYPMASILYMQISWFSNLSEMINQRVFSKKFAKIGRILATGESSRHLEYAN